MIRKAFLEDHGKIIARITFTLSNSTQDQAVYLVGDFNDWDCDSHPLQKDRLGHWTITLDLETRRTYQFRYLSGGRRWMCDSEADAYVYNRQGAHSFVVVTDPEFKRCELA